MASWRAIDRLRHDPALGGGAQLGARRARAPPRPRSSIPAAASISRLSSLAASETTASSASSESREVSRAAVLARIVATPSSRLSCSALRCASVSSVSALTRARSSRTSSATTWNLVRADGVTGPRSDGASTSRTARASTGMMPSLSPCRRPLRWPPWVRLLPDWRWPRLAKELPFDCPDPFGRGTGPGAVPGASRRGEGRACGGAWLVLRRDAAPDRRLPGRATAGVDTHATSPDRMMSPGPPTAFHRAHRTLPGPRRGAGGLAADRDAARLRPTATATALIRLAVDLLPSQLATERSDRAPGVTLDRADTDPELGGRFLDRKAEPVPQDHGAPLHGRQLL